MKRLDFLRALLSSGLGMALFRPAAVASPAPARRYLYSGTVAGLRYYDFEQVRPLLMQTRADRGSSPPTPPHGLPKRMYQINPSSGTTYAEHAATLRLEPDNPHDHRAIEVHWNSHKLGYIARRDNKVLHNLMREGASLTALVRVVADDDHWHPDEGALLHSLRIRVYEEVGGRPLG